MLVKKAHRKNVEAMDLDHMPSETAEKLRDLMDWSGDTMGAWADFVKASQNYEANAALVFRIYEIGMADPSLTMEQAANKALDERWEKIVEAHREKGYDNAPE